MSAAVTAIDEDGNDVPCQTQTQWMVESLHFDPRTGVLLLEVLYNGWSDLCWNPSPDHPVFRLPTDQQPAGWTKVP